MKFLQTLLDWSEVWALLIPLIIIAICNPKEKHIRILRGYVLIGFILNFSATFMLEYYDLVPTWMYVNNMVNNNLPYNIHSIIRVLFFSWYIIIIIGQFRFSGILKLILAAYMVLVLINFIFIESPFFLSTHLFAAESIVLLIMCLSYFFRSIQDESHTNWLKHPSFLVCAGICLYEVITFFIFLFFYPLSQKDPEFFVVTMRIYNITFVLLCILLALAFYKSKNLSQNKT
ncbi:MAG: hypothetical protein IPI68_01515 [Chitinophagaceae bacterium]|nr:hypothetical protein [Chitinophagaceae bacterium]